MIDCRARTSRLGALGLVLLLLPALAACGGGGSGSGSRLRVVAAESFWGSIAAQLGGDRVSVTSVISSPNTDPHEYEPTTADARTFATAQLAIVNGVGYDPWAPQLLDAGPVAGRIVLNVGDVVGKKSGDNPHRWYFPSDVEKVIGAITADYVSLDPADSTYFTQREHDYETSGLSAYHALIAAIQRDYAGTPVGATENIAAGITEATRLHLVTPVGFMDAISAGSDPTAQDRSAVDEQVTSHSIKVLIYNSQNATPDVQSLVDAARSAGIPVVSITETPAPPDATFQDWQSAQLRQLQAALARAA